MSEGQASRRERARRLLARQEVRFLLAGGWNTVFGYGFFAGLYWLLGRRVHYMLLVAVSNVVAVSMAYATYKLFVFPTKGNMLREYLRFYSVYGVSIGLSLLLFPVCIEWLRLNAYLAQALILVVTILFSFFGHKHYSFR